MSSGYDLRYHGDQDVAEGLVDLAVNVRLSAPPVWLRDRLASCLSELAAYPDTSAASEAVAARHGRHPDEVLLTAGAAEAFTLLATGVSAHKAVVVHPQFTEPEAALRAAGHTVHRVVLGEADGFVFDPTLVPEDADLVVLGNPTNPTSVLHPASSLRQLARPGRLVVVDEAFMDAVPGEAESLAGQWVHGIVVVRSLTKTWGIAGLRAGYLLGDPQVVDRLRAVQPHWSVSTLAAVALVACSEQGAVAEAEVLAQQAVRQCTHLVAGLAALGPRVVSPARAPFVLARVPDGGFVRERMRAAGYAMRRGETFPGLGPDWVRIAVRDEATTDAFLAALARNLGARTRDG